MNFLTEMHFYWWKKGNKICVQNMVAGYRGQYHEHTLSDFEKWKEGIELKFLHEIKQEKEDEKKNRITNSKLIGNI